MITSYILINSRELSPGKISHVIGLDATKERLIGSTGTYNKNPIDYNSFEFSIVNNQDIPISELVKKTTYLLGDKEIHFKELFLLDPDIYISLKIVIRIEDNQMPDLYFENNFMRLLGNINASLDCDMYNMS